MTGEAVLDIDGTELIHAVLVGTRRRLFANQQKRTSRFPYPHEGGNLMADIVGAIGELVVAKSLGIYWSPSVGARDSDVGDVAGYQVRATTIAGASLVIRDNDRDERPYVLVIGEPPRLTIAGWIYPPSARRVEWRRSPNGGPPAYFVPAGSLRPWDERPFA
jgi:hypothetical protein